MGLSSVGNLIQAIGNVIEAGGKRDSENMYFAKEDAKDAFKDIFKVVDHGVHAVT
ncbi:MAG: hypothetical protein H6765_06190 [Candidatus Peribacteria bacterium]|nr:MAG: hypothetical protein H6765_06190 [Candidatus Peribacteria bacterium]